MGGDSYQYAARFDVISHHRHGDQSQCQSKEVADVDRLNVAVWVLIQPGSVATHMKQIQL